MARLKCGKCKVKKDEDEFYKSSPHTCKDCCKAASVIFKEKNKVQLKATLRLLVVQQDSIHEKLEKHIEKQERHIEKQDEELRQIRKMLKKMSTK